MAVFVHVRAQRVDTLNNCHDVISRRIRDVSYFVKYDIISTAYLHKLT